MKHWRMPLLLALLVAFFASCFTLETRERDQGYSHEALLNPWLAAGRVLERNGLRVRYAPEYGRLPAHARVIVLATPLDYLDAAEQRELFDWVKRGGHLVVELLDSSEPAEEKDREVLTRQLDVHLREHEFDRKTLEAVQKEARLRPTQLDGEGRISTHFDESFFLESGRLAPRWVVHDRYGAHIMRFLAGEGRITVVSDLEWMQNRHLGEGDHGALLWRMVDAQPGDEVWLIHGTERPSLLAMVWESASYFLVALAIFVLAWLWAVSRRFGPLQNPLPVSRRRLSEHLEAAGRYLLRQGGAGLLFNASRQRLLTHLQRRYPQWKRLPNAELAQQLAARSHIESRAILRLLESDTPDHLLQFAADIRLINRLRKAL